MSTIESPVVESVKKPSRRVREATARRVDKPTKTAVYLSTDSLRRLGLTSLMERRSQSEIVEELIRLHLRKYVVQTRDRSAVEDSSDQSAQAISTAA